MQKILVVEDSPLLLEMISNMLRARGFEVIEANNGYEALEKLDGRRIDLVTTDLIMPGIDGIELTREIRTRIEYKTIPILMLTTQSDEMVKREGRSAGVTGWVVKPFSPVVLTAKVRKLIARPGL
jgi:two-component system, chemotaxis family, chemotaxis protein CheY